MNVIKELRKDFIGVGIVRGFRFTQICKTDSAFLYRVDTSDSIYFEVFERRYNTWFNCISYPTNKAFGSWASLTPNIERAFELLNDLSNNDSIIEADTDAYLSTKIKG